VIFHEEYTCFWQDPLQIDICLLTIPKTRTKPNPQQWRFFTISTLRSPHLQPTAETSAATVAAIYYSAPCIRCVVSRIGRLSHAVVCIVQKTIERFAALTPLPRRTFWSEITRLCHLCCGQGLTLALRRGRWMERIISNSHLADSSVKSSAGLQDAQINFLDSTVPTHTHTHKHVWLVERITSWWYFHEPYCVA